MTTSMSVFSNKTITHKGLSRLMQDLGGEIDLQAASSWRLNREGVSVIIGLGDDLEWIPDSDMKQVANMLDSWPKSQVVFVYNALSEDSPVYDLIRAVCLAMSEIWPIVLDDNGGTLERVLPPSQAPRKRRPHRL